MKKDDRITAYNSEDVTFAENMESMRLEAEFAKKHRHDTDDELIRYLRRVAKKLGHIPKKHEVLGYALIKSRLGPWPRVLEMAGLKKKINKEEEVNNILHTNT